MAKFFRVGRFDLKVCGKLWQLWYSFFSFWECLFMFIRRDFEKYKVTVRKRRFAKLCKFRIGNGNFPCDLVVHVFFEFHI